MLRTLLDVVYPPRCAGCGDGPFPFCAICRERLVPLVPPHCRRCGAPRRHEVATCRDCPPDPLGTARAAFRFEGPVRAAVHRLKFSGWRRVAEPLGEAMAAAWHADPSVAPADADVMTWVPLSRRRLAARGFDQARLLARSTGRSLELPVARLLVRTSDAGPQARRGREERFAAMLGRFRAVETPPSRVLLVDDVLTTGATAAACAEALVAAGARRVHLLTAARALAIGGTTDILLDGLTSGSVVARGNVLR